VEYQQAAEEREGGGGRRQERIEGKENPPNNLITTASWQICNISSLPHPARRRYTIASTVANTAAKGEPKKGDDDDDDDDFHDGSRVVHYTMHGLTAESTYEVIVSARNSKGEGMESNSLIMSTSTSVPPKTPQNVHMKSKTGYSIDISWSAPEDSEVNTYEAERDDWYTDKPFANFYTGKEMTARAEKLLPAVPYSFRVRACNGAGCSAYTPVLNITTKATGACTNRDDLTSGKANPNIIDSVANCIYDCAPQYWNGEQLFVSCTQNCSHTELKLSLDCSRCFADFGVCIFRKCPVQCSMNYKSNSCVNCYTKKCIPRIMECTGLPEYFLD